MLVRDSGKKFGQGGRRRKKGKLMVYKYKIHLSKVNYFPLSVVWFQIDRTYRGMEAFPRIFEQYTLNFPQKLADFGLNYLKQKRHFCPHAPLRKKASGHLPPSFWNP